MKSRWLLGCAVFALACVVNPGYFAGCTSHSSASKFSFGEKDMLNLLASVTGADPLPFESDGHAYTLKLVLTQNAGQDSDTASWLIPQHAFALRAYACATRTFLQSAAACFDMTELPVTGTATLRSADGGTSTLLAELPIAGTLRVIGDDLNNATLDLNDSVDTISLRSRDGRALQLSVVDAPQLGPGQSDIAYMAP